MLETPLSLYIHIPWCIKKCPYCDFNSHEARSTVPEDEYIDALIIDLNQQAELVPDRKIISIFIGGGTPSLFSANCIKRLLQAAQEQLSLAPNIEITIEANPGTLDQQNFAGFRDAGINRLSIGVQSFNDTQLLTLGRIHTAQTAHDAIAAVTHAGFENFNIDLMYALPKQTIKEAEFDIEQAIALQPTHISYYQLTIEPNTHFYKHPPPLPDNELAWDMQLQGTNLLAQYNYQQYEVSAYTKSGFKCIHNDNYWQFGDYIGLGAGAHQKLSNLDDGTIFRSEKPQHPQQYIRQMQNGNVSNKPQWLSQSEITFEYLLNALRLKKGFNRKQFERHTGLAYEKLEHRLKPLQDEGLLIADHEFIRCSEKGYQFLDELLQQLLPQKA